MKRRKTGDCRLRSVLRKSTKRENRKKSVRRRWRERRESRKDYRVRRSKA